MERWRQAQACGRSPALRRPRPPTRLAPGRPASLPGPRAARARTARRAVPGRARPGRPTRAGARKRSGDWDAAGAPASGWLGDEDAALGWAPPDETVVPDGTDMAAASLWAGDGDPVRDFETQGDSGRP